MLRDLRGRKVEVVIRSTRAWEVHGINWRRGPGARCLSKQALLTTRLFRREPEVSIRRRRRHAPTRRALKETMLHQERLVDLFDRVRILADCRTDRVQADGTAIELLDDRLENACIHVVKPEHVHVEQFERLVGDRLRDDALVLHLSEVADTSQQTVGDARRSTRAPSNLRCAVAVDLDLHHVGRPPHDQLEILSRIEVQTLLDAETRSHRRREHAESRGRADERELFNRHRDRLRLRSIGEPNVDLVVLHRRIEELFDDRPETMDLVDEQNVARAQVGQRHDEIARLLERWTRGRPDIDAELTGDQLGQRRFAESRRAEKQRVIQRLPARERGVDEDAEAVFHLLLHDELRQALRPKGQLDDGFVGQHLRRRDLGSRHGHQSIRREPELHANVLLEAYSARSAISGSTRTARRAGSQLASTATPIRTGTTIMTATTLCTVKPSRLALITRMAITVAGSPIASPIAETRMPSPKKCLTIRVGLAPIARRTPTSRVRWATACAMIA